MIFLLHKKMSKPESKELNTKNLEAKANINEVCLILSHLGVL